MRQRARILSSLGSAYDGTVYNVERGRRQAKIIRRVDGIINRYAENMNAIDRKNGRNPMTDPGTITRKFTRRQYMGLSGG